MATDQFSGTQIRRIGRSSWGLLFCAYALMALGSSSMAAWFLEWRWFLQFSRDCPAIQFNTALGLALCGSGFWAMLCGWFRAARVLAVSTLMLGLLTLAEYVSGWNFGIDEVFVRGTILTDLSHPGRMAPNTAFCFAVAGAALLFLLQDGPISSRRATLISLLGALLAVIGVAGAAAYLMGIQRELNWGGFSHMAPQTAGGIALVGAFILTAAWRWIGAGISVGIGFLAGMTLTLICFGLIRDVERRRADDVFHRQTGEWTQRIGERIRDKLEILDSLVAFYAASQKVERAEFAAFADSLRSADPSVRVVGWLERVPASGRRSYEAEMSRQLGRKVEIFDQDPANGPRESVMRREYLPITYTSPQDGLLDLIGLDLADDPVRAPVLAAARDTGRPAATGRVQIYLPGQTAHYGVVCFAPVYQNGKTVSTVQERRAHLIGYVSVVLDVGRAVEQALAGSTVDDAAIIVSDVTNPSRHEVLHERAPGGAIHGHPQAKASSAGASRQELEVGGRKWRVHCAPAAGLPPLSGMRLSGLMLVSGASFTLLLAAYLWSLANRTAEIQRRVRAQTRDLRQASEELDRMAAIVRDSNDAIISASLDGTILSWNKAAQDIYGYTPEEAVGAKVFMTCPPDKVEESREILEQVKRGISVKQLDTRRVRKNGEVFDVSLAVSPVKNADGRVIAASAIVRDVTEQKRMTRELQQSERHYRAVLQDQTDMICRYRPDGVLTFVNKAYCDSWRRTEAELLGRNLLEVIEDQEGREKFRRYLEFLRTLTPDNPIHINEISSVYPDGSTHWLHWADRAIFDEQGRLAEIQAVGTDVTEKRIADDRLEEHRRRLKALLDNIPDMAWMKDRAGRFIAVNKAVARAAGREPEEMVGRTDEEFWPAELSARYRTDDEEVLRSGRPKRLEEPFLREDGQTHWIETIKTPILGRNGEVIGTVGIARDVTERKRFEEELRFTHFSVDHSGESMFWVDEHGHFIRVNDAACRLLEYTREEFLKMSVWDIDPVILKELWPEQLAEVRFKKLVRIESVHRSKSGREFPVELVINHIDYDGKVYHCVFARDISERKRAEHNLRESEERFRLLAENTSDLISLHDTTGRILYASPSVKRILGYDPAELIGKDVYDLIHPDERERSRSEAHLPVLSGRSDIVYSLRLRRKDGEYVWVESGLTPVLDEKGLMSGIQCSTRDISDRRRLEAEVREVQKMEAIGQMAGGIAHDFNNMLAGILGYARLALDQIPEASDARKDLEQVLKGGQRARELVAQILAFSRHSHGTQKRAPHQMTRIIHEAMKLIRPAIPSSVKIDLDLPPGLPLVEVDPVQIYQVIVNLCINAKEAIEGEGRIVISLAPGRAKGGTSRDTEKESAADKFVTLTIRDTGCGIPPENLARIFEPFFTTKKHSHGTGMGLAVVYGIVRNCGGEVFVESAPGRGSAFFVQLPASRADPGRDAPRKKRPDSRGGDERVLVIDDEEPLARMMAKTLERLGYRVTIQTESMQALETIRNAPDAFDVVVTDQTMPGMTGDRLTEEILKINPSIPVILCTGFSNILSAKRQKEIGAWRVLQKPFADQELEAEVRGALDARKGRG